MARSAPAEPPPELPPEEKAPGERYLTLMEHLQELRYRVMVSAFAVVIGLCVSAVFANRIINFLEQPARDRAPADFQFQFIEPFENFVTYFKVALLGGLVLAMPVIVYQVLRFVAPGLRGGERRWLYGTVVGATGFFLAGVAFSYYFALPPALNFRPASWVSGIFGPWLPGAHCGYRSVIGPGRTGIDRRMRNTCCDRLDASTCSAMVPG